MLNILMSHWWPGAAWDENPVGRPRSLCAKPLYSSAPEKTTYWTCVESTFKIQTLRRSRHTAQQSQQGHPPHLPTLPLCFSKNPTLVLPSCLSWARCACPVPPAFPRERPHLPSMRDTGMVGSYIREVPTGLIQLWA